MILMDSDTLERRGVAALGARRKLLRVSPSLAVNNRSHIC